MPTLKQSLELLLAGDRELYALLCEGGFVPREDAALAPEHLEAARVARTLVHELEINWAGVERENRQKAPAETPEERQQREREREQCSAGWRISFASIRGAKSL